MLVIGTTGDAATPLEQAERVAETSPTATWSVREGEGHTAYGSRIACRTSSAAFLIDGTENSAPPTAPAAEPVCGRRADRYSTTRVPVIVVWIAQWKGTRRPPAWP